MRFPLLAAFFGLLLIPSPLVSARQTSSNSRQAQQEGPRQSHTVKVAVAIDRTGKVISATLAESSGSKDFDDAALAMLRKAAPFPKPPSEMEGDILNFTVPVTFTQRGSKVPLLSDRKAAPSTPDQGRPDAGANIHSICRGC
ncbi:energy transducer TonB [Bradyrhizobium sp. CCGUVB4N]|uniref:energy transducer TonB n=1 Tax=Bradyrhizobium sp. CCGUVB4N TaxID=2949631 RepID=UPI0035C75ECC